MSVFQCLNCQGIYTDHSGGGIYYHRCPSLPPDLPEAQRRDYNPRNENLTVGRLGTIPDIKSAGQGVTCLDNPELTQPRWITNLENMRATEEEL